MNAQSYRQTRLWGWLRESWAVKLAKACERCRREFWAWSQTPEMVFPHVDQLARSIGALYMGYAQFGAEKEDPEAPIFLLSTGMRTGSTLLQRILVTDPRVLLWGEPLGDMALICKVAEMMSHSISPWNLEQWKNHNPNLSSIATTWIADLYPPGEDFRLALRSFFDRWLGEPARQRGFVRWGFKEVRLGATEATLLHWLYPRAKFIILTRHPYDCYKSGADSNWQLYHQYPDIRIDSAARFARIWNQLALSWSELPAGFPCFRVRYEDIVGGKVNFRELESWLGITIRENVALSVPVGGTAKRSRLSWYERLIIAREASAGMRALGYSEDEKERRV